MNKACKMATAALSLVFLLTGCSATKGDDPSGSYETISVISREEGSGTRGAFVELFGIEQKDVNGNKVDYTTDEANITNNTAGMMTNVAGDKNAIGYVSLGSLNNTVKALKIEGEEPTVDNVKSGIYKVARPFNIVIKNDLNTLAQDFVNFILSTKGQAIVEENHYIPLDNVPDFTSQNPSGKITVGGSSSVSPVMQKLMEAYKKINASATVELQTHDSTTGITSTIDGTFDIGLASRELKQEETAKGVRSMKIAMDGIAVIVNKDNSIQDLSKEQIKKIFTGEITEWSDIG